MVDIKQCLAEFELVFTSKIAKLARTELKRTFLSFSFFIIAITTILDSICFFSMANKSLCAILRIERQSGNQNGTKKIMVVTVTSARYDFTCGFFFPFRLKTQGKSPKIWVCSNQSNKRYTVKDRRLWFACFVLKRLWCSHVLDQITLNKEAKVWNDWNLHAISKVKDSNSLHLIKKQKQNRNHGNLNLFVEIFLVLSRRILRNR